MICTGTFSFANADPRLPEVLAVALRHEPLAIVCGGLVIPCDILRVEGRFQQRTKVFVMSTTEAPLPPDRTDHLQADAAAVPKRPIARRGRRQVS